MLLRAMEARGAEVGRRYTILDLAAESHTHFTAVSQATTGKRQPTRAALEAWSAALSPHFDLDAALIAAGHPPADGRKAGVLRRMWQLTSEQWAEVERWLGERATERADEGAGDERGSGEGDDEATAQS